jgi:hypothetical protein
MCARLRQGQPALTPPSGVSALVSRAGAPTPTDRAMRRWHALLGFQECLELRSFPGFCCCRASACLGSFGHIVAVSPRRMRLLARTSCNRGVVRGGMRKQRRTGLARRMEIAPRLTLHSGAFRGAAARFGLFLPPQCRRWKRSSRQWRQRTVHSWKAGNVCSKFPAAGPQTFSWMSHA